MLHDEDFEICLLNVRNSLASYVWPASYRFLKFAVVLPHVKYFSAPKLPWS